MVDAGGRGAHADLGGLRVLVTRPRHQSAGLAALIEQHGGKALRFPVIDILPARDRCAARAALSSLDDFALVIFVSVNAVTHGLALMDSARGRKIRARVAAVGAGTALALQRAGFADVLRPAAGAGSEGLLELAELSATRVAGSRVLIVRGQSGRPLLGRTLSKRGARVTYAEVYRRARAQVSGDELAELRAGGGIDAIVITSAEGLDNLFALFGDGAADWLKRIGYVVVSERVAAHARALGIREQPVVAAGADDESLLEALIQWREVHSNA